MNITNQINQIGVVPVIALSDAEQAVPLVKALAAGGIPVAEITFRTKEGEECMRRVAKELPEILLGAGTVLTIDQVDRALDAGAKFIVSPGFNPKVVKHCIAKNVPIFPGCITPSEMEQAMELGIETIKFFPAEQAGGLAFIKAVAAPYPNLTFMPTGGIGPANLGQYAAFDKIVACGGSWMVKGSAEEITKLSREAVEIVQTAHAKRR